MVMAAKALIQAIDLESNRCSFDTVGRIAWRHPSNQAKKLYVELSFMLFMH